MNLLVYVHLRNIYRSTGVGRVSREITEHLAQQQDVRLRILADPHDHDMIVTKVGSPWTEFRYAFMRHETTRQQALWYLLDGPAAENYWPETDLVYCTAESYVPTRKAKLVVTSHDMQLFEAGAQVMTRNLLQQRFKWWLLFHRLSGKADLFHAISSYSAEQLAHYFPGTRGRIKVIPNAVSGAFFQPPSCAGMQSLRVLGIVDRPYVLVPGGLHYRKNADLILTAWPRIRSRCPGLSLVVTNHNSPEYVERARSLGASVILTGYQDQENLVALYANAEIVWFPSRYEGFGMPVLEAMACGTPVISSNAAALPEVAGGAAAAMLDPDKSADHEDAVVALTQDSAARRNASELGRARASQFTWSRSAEMLMDEFTSLI